MSVRTPLQRAADEVRAANRSLYDAGPDPGPQYAPPEFSPPIIVDDLNAPELRYQFERLRCYALADVFRHWFLAYVAWLKIPLDNVLPTVDVTAALVEATMLARVRWPHLAPLQDEPDGDDGPGGITAADAAEMGLTVAPMPRNRPRKRKGTLPGCATEGCTELRRPGEQWCPACSRKMIQKWRSEGR